MGKVALKKNNFIQFRFEILLLFIFLEVLLYDKLPFFQGAISVLEYCFIFFCVLINKRVGIMYLFSFTLLSMGAWSYVIQESLPYNFWGFRLFGFSFNVLFTIVLALYVLASNKFSFFRISLSTGNRFFILFIIQSIIVGSILCFIVNENYSDNFFKDILIYIPFFFYLYLLNSLSLADGQLIIKYGIASAIIAMLLSYVTNQFFEYGDGFSFALMNSFSFISVFTFFFFRNLFTLNQFIFFLLSLLFLLSSGKVFIGSKSLIVIFVVILWVTCSSWKSMGYIILSLGIIVLFLNPLISWVSTNISGDLVVSYKFNQILSIFELVDIDIIAMSNTSMGNIVAEAATIYKYMLDHPIYFLFGKGFGGGLADVNGYLAIYVGDGAGYGEIDLLRNQFTRMHLPFFEIIIKTGVIGMLMYLRMLYYSFKKKDIYFLSFFLIALTVFSNSKEMLLLCMLFDHVASKLNLKQLNYSHSNKEIII